jgi:HAMP domain-containing protein
MTIPVRKFHNSLLARLGVGILPFVVIVFVVSLGFLFKWSRDMVRQEAIERANLMLTNTSLRVGSYIQEIQTITNNTIWLVEENLVPDSLLGYTRRVVELNTDACGCSITMEPDFFPQYGHSFSAYTFFDGDSLATFIEEPYDYYNKVWYKRAYETGEPVWSDPYDDSDDGSWAVSEWISSYSAPLKDKQGTTIGVISTDLSLARLSQTLSEEVPYEHSYCMMLGQKGKYFVHTDTAKLAHKTIFDGVDPLEHPDIIALGHEMVAGKSGYMEVNVDGDDCLVFYKPLENTPWSIALICTESDIFSRYNSLLYILIPLLTIGLLLLIYFLRLIVNYFIHPLNRLASQTHHIADGHFDVSMPKSKRVDAIGRLQNNFSAMQHSLAKHISHLERVNEETEQRNKELVNANQQAEEAAQRQVVFLQNILHQIRTPLNIIMGFVQVLRDDYTVIPREEMVTITETMKHNATSISRMVHMLTAASALDVGKVVDCEDHISCNGIVCEAVNIYNQRASKPDVSLQVKTEVPDDLFVNVHKIISLRF